MWLVKSLLALCLSAAFLSEKIGLPVSADSLFSSEDVRLLSIHDFVISYLLLNICFQTRSKRSTSSSEEVSDIKLKWVTDKKEMNITFGQGGRSCGKAIFFSHEFKFGCGLRAFKKAFGELSIKGSVLSEKFL